MNVYTRTGDGGQTSLFSGERVPKSHPRVEAYGDVDELNSVIGALIAALPPDHPEWPELQRIQANLFQVGAWLATTPGSAASARLTPFSTQHSQQLEQAIDRMNAELSPLTSFILPGGHPTAAWAHIARTVCRRAERHVLELGVSDEAFRPILAFLNRLSDYLFVLARYCNHLAGTPDVRWLT